MLSCLGRKRCQIRQRRRAISQPRCQREPPALCNRLPGDVPAPCCHSWHPIPSQNKHAPVTHSQLPSQYLPGTAGQGSTYPPNPPHNRQHHLLIRAASTCGTAAESLPLSPCRSLLSRTKIKKEKQLPTPLGNFKLLESNARVMDGFTSSIPCQGGLFFGRIRHL